MMKYKAYLMTIILVAVVCVAAFLGLNHWIRGQIDSQASSVLEGAGNRLISQIRLKAFKMIQDLSHHTRNEKLLSALKRLPNISSDTPITEAHNLLETTHQETTPALKEIKDKISMSINLVLLTPQGTVISRFPDSQQYGDNMAGIPAIQECAKGISRDGLYEIDGKPQLMAVSAVQNERGENIGCLMSYNQLGSTEAQALKQASGFEVAIFLRKILAASTLKPELADQLIPHLDSREIIWFGNPEESKPIFVDYRGKAYSARASHLPSGTDMLHLVAIHPSTYFITIHQKTQNIALIGCGALLTFALLLCFILSGTSQSNEIERLRDASAMLANGSASSIVVENYSGIYKEIAGHLAQLIGSESKPGLITSYEPISDLLGPYSKPSTSWSDENQDAPSHLHEEAMGSFENVLGGDQANPRPVDLAEQPDELQPKPPFEQLNNGYLQFPDDNESQPQPTAHPMQTYPASSEFEPEDTVVTPAPSNLIMASSSPESNPESFEPFDRTNDDAPPTLSGFEPEQSIPTDNSTEVHYREVFNQFIHTKKQCGEPITGLSYDRFSEKLRKNESDLKNRYNCNSVKFQVYVKNGKAALKASPVR